MPRQLVGVIGSGLMGRDPFDRRSWSTSSYFFFSELKRRGALARAFGVEAPPLVRYACIARNYTPDREAWRTHFYNDVRYRDALTREIARRLTPDDLASDVLQIGAMYDVPALVRGRARCFSYHDGNLAETLRSPYAPKGLRRKNVDRALAYERKVYHGLTTIFAMSEYLRRSFIADFGVPADRVVAVGAGMNLETIPEPSPDKGYDTDEILFIGVDFPRKGGWELLRAFRAVRERRPHARLHIVGPHHLIVPPELEAGVEVHGFLSKTNPVDLDRLKGLFARCSLFAMPSLYEPFGIAPLEAMVNQIPAVVTDGWALREMVTPGETGWLVPCGDVEALASALSDALSDPHRLRRFGEASRARALEGYTWERVIGRILQKVGFRDPSGTERVLTGSTG